MLAAFVGLASAAQVACDSSKLDRFVAAVEIARGLPAATGVAGEEAELVDEGFELVASAAREFRAAKDAKTWRRLVAVFNKVKARPSWQRLRPALRLKVEAFLGVAGRILQSIEPTPTLGARPDAVPSRPDFKHVTDDDLKDLERAARGR